MIEFSWIGQAGFCFSAKKKQQSRIRKNESQMPGQYAVADISDDLSLVYREYTPHSRLRLLDFHVRFTFRQVNQVSCANISENKCSESLPIEHHWCPVVTIKLLRIDI